MNLRSSLLAVIAWAVVLGVPRAAAQPVNLTSDRWVLENSVDSAGNTWNDSRLVFTSQTATGSGFDLVGYFDWISNNGHFGRELFLGTYATSTRRITLIGQSIDPTMPSQGIVTATYGVDLSSDAQRLENGAWSATGVIPGAWAARREGLVPPVIFAHSIVGNIVTLRWAQPTAGPVPTSYVLEGGVTPGQVLASIPTGSAVSLFSFAAPNGAFYVRVRSVAGGQTSAPSNEIRIFVNQAVAPSAPANLLGLVDGSSVALSWRPTFTGGSPSTFVLDVSGSLSTSLALGLADTFTFNGVPGGTYTFRVRAENGAGSSAASNAVTLTFPQGCLGAPSTPADFLTYRVGNVVHLLWNPAATGVAPTSFVLNVTGAFNVTLPLATRGISSPVPPGSYTFTVTATNACGASAPTAAQTVVVP